jgi:DNA-binding FadR family transcriptional regulator
VTGEARSGTPSIVDRLRAALKARVASGDYAVGSRLPGERALAAELGANRSMVREAIRGLEAIGVVEVRGRSGAYVQSATAGRVGDALMLLTDRVPHGVTVRNLLETRRMLEVEIAGVAATRRTKAELRDIGRALADSGSNESVEAWADADVEFHGAIARATHNPLYTIIYDSLRTVLRAQRMRTGTALPETWPRSFRSHQRIFDRVCAGDSAGARRAMRDHLAEAEQTLSRLAIEIDGALRPPAGEQAG